MHIWPRRKPESPPPPVALPSLDRLAGLIERVVELVDEVSGTRVAAPERRPPERPPEARPALPAAPQRAAAAVDVVASDGAWFAFVSSPQGYTLVELPGSVPAPGDELAVEGIRYRVVRYAPSPLPGDRRRCVVLEMEEPPEPERTSDA
jgi:hypothetical protein